jgi:hypothetical protein
VVQGGKSNIAEATPAAKASPRWCRAAGAGTNSPRGSHIRFMRASGPVLLGGKLRAQHNKVLHEKSLGGNPDDGVNGGHPK